MGQAKLPGFGRRLDALLRIRGYEKGGKVDLMRFCKDKGYQYTYVYKWLQDTIPSYDNVLYLAADLGTSPGNLLLGFLANARLRRDGAHLVDAGSYLSPEAEESLVKNAAYQIARGKLWFEETQPLERDRLPKRERNTATTRRRTVKAVVIAALGLSVLASATPNAYGSTSGGTLPAAAEMTSPAPYRKVAPTKKRTQWAPSGDAPRLASRARMSSARRVFVPSLRMRRYVCTASSRRPASSCAAPRSISSSS